MTSKALSQRYNVSLPGLFKGFHPLNPVVKIIVITTAMNFSAGIKSALAISGFCPEVIIILVKT